MDLSDTPELDTSSNPGPSSAQPQAQPSGQTVTMLAVKGGVVSKHTVQLSFTLEPHWRIPMMLGSDGNYISQMVDWAGRKNGERVSTNYKCSCTNSNPLNSLSHCRN